jgi:hypothetical protein
MGIYVVRTFVQLRQASRVHADLAKRLTELELSTERLELSQRGTGAGEQMAACGELCGQETRCRQTNRHARDQRH